MFGRMLWRSIQRRKKRVGLAVLAIFTGASLAAALLTVAVDINDKVGRELRAYGANILVLPKTDALRIQIGGVDYGSPEPAYLDVRELYKIKKIFWKYNIVAFNPYLSATVMATRTGNTGDPRVSENSRRVLLTGTWFNQEVKVPGEAFRSFKTGVKKLAPWWKVDGSWIEGPDDSTGSMVGGAVAEQMGIRPGDRLVVSAGGRSKALVVRGIVTTGGAEDQQIFANLGVVQELLRLPGKADKVLVSALTTPEDAFAKRDTKKMTPKEYEKWYCTPYISSIILQIKEVLPGAEVKAIQQVAAAEGAFLSKTRLLLVLVTVVALLASALGVATIMSTSVLERRREIGIIKSVGADARQVAALFLAEAGLIGLAGGLAGYFAGIGLAKAIGLGVFGVAISPQVLVLPVTLGIAASVALLGSAIPVRSALRVNPVVVLQGE
ncbi:MAG: ABC transporter permease [Syntrophothermus sp.]